MTGRHDLIFIIRGLDKFPTGTIAIDAHDPPDALEAFGTFRRRPQGVQKFLGLLEFGLGGPQRASSSLTRASSDLSAAWSQTPNRTKQHMSATIVLPHWILLAFDDEREPIENSRWPPTSVRYVRAKPHPSRCSVLFFARQPVGVDSGGKFRTRRRQVMIASVCFLPSLRICGFA